MPFGLQRELRAAALQEASAFWLRSPAEAQEARGASVLLSGTAWVRENSGTKGCRGLTR